MTAAQKAWIYSASYKQLLEHWRFAPAGDPMFMGDTGEYYAKVLREKRDADPARHTATSKAIGWER